MSCKLEVSIPFQIEYSMFLMFPCNSETKIYLRVSYVMIHVYPTTFPACFQLMLNIYIDFHTFLLDEIHYVSSSTET